MSDVLLKVATEDKKFEFETSREKILIGRDPHADWVCDDHTISRHHAMLVKSLEGWIVLDLYSTNGLFINGERTKEAKLKNGDQFTLGSVTFILFDQVAHLKEEPLDPMDATRIFAYSNELFPEFGLNQMLNPSELSEGLSTFDEPYDIIAEDKKSKLEVLVYSSGTLIGVDYLDWPLTELKISSEPVKKAIFFPGLTEELVFHFKDGLITAPDFFQTNQKNSLLSVGPTFYHRGTQQISLRLVDHTFKSVPMPWWLREKTHYINLTKAVLGLFLPFILLLFVTWPVQEDDKEVTIVYQELQPVPEEKVANTDVQKDAKPVEQEKAMEQIKDPQKIVTAKAKGTNTPEPPAPSVEPVVQPKKSFSFKSSTSISPSVVDGTVALRDSSDTKTKTDAGSSGVVADTSSLSAKSGSGSLDGSRKGFDVDGKGAASLGARGLVKKKGFDHSYIEPRTVVLGSMDPELLRKILQEYLPQFRHCYQQELGRNPDVKGVIDLNFTINQNGRVDKKNIRAKDARFSSKGIGCMENVLGIIPFPKPKGGGVVDVKQPLNFLSETEKI